MSTRRRSDTASRQATSRRAHLRDVVRQVADVDSHGDFMTARAHLFSAQYDWLVTETRLGPYNGLHSRRNTVAVRRALIVARPRSAAAGAAQIPLSRRLRNRGVCAGPLSRQPCARTPAVSLLGFLEQGLQMRPDKVRDCARTVLVGVHAIALHQRRVGHHVHQH